MERDLDKVEVLKSVSYRGSATKPDKKTLEAHVPLDGPSRCARLTRIMLESGHFDLAGRDRETDSSLERTVSCDVSLGQT